MEIETKENKGVKRGAEIERNLEAMREKKYPLETGKCEGIQTSG